MGFLAAAPVVPMLIGAGVGAIADKDNPLRGAMLGAVGGGTLAPLATAATGIGALGGSTAAAETALAAAPASAMAGADAAGVAAGLPSMEAIAGTMPGGMAAPGVMGANGLPFGANAAMATQAYNAMPVMDRVSALFHKPTFGGKNPLGSAGRMIMGQMTQPTPQQSPPPAVAGASPPRQAPPYQPVGRFITGMPGNLKKRDPRDDMWGYS